MTHINSNNDSEKQHADVYKKSKGDQGMYRKSLLRYQFLNLVNFMELIKKPKMEEPKHAKEKK